MFVKKIELCGFKSFAQKTVFEFDRNKENSEGGGIVCVVGPNGSGKSNVADALRWVIGEKSAKNIRGKRSEDVIFAGSDKRPRVGSARVSVYFDNSNKHFNLDYSEVIVTRKIFRSGENQYLINGSAARLTDVVELLAGAGIGKESYAIINQGMTDRILSASPPERKNILEEAAGIKEFQIKKSHSLKKISKTEENLTKVKSSISELIPDLKNLERQKNKIEKSRFLRGQLKDKKVEFYSALWRELNFEIKEKEREFKKICQETEREKKNIFAIKNKISNFSGENKSADKKIEILESEKTELEKEIYEEKKDISIIEGKIELEKQKKENFEKPDFIPVNKKYTLDKLREIKSQYADWKLRADKKDKFSSNEIKTFLIKTEGQIEGLIKGIRNGKIKKVKAQEEINKQRIKIKELIKDYEQEISAKDKNIQKKQVRIEKIKKQQEDIKQAEIKQREEELQAKDELRRKEFELEKASGYQNHLNQALNNKKREILELKKKIKEELNQDPKNLSGLERTKDACQLEKEIEKINWQLEQIGGVDEAAIRKFDEIQKRYDFLVKEAKDLEETLKNLNKVAEEMDVIIKKRFEQAFEGVNKKFGNYFEKIFGGGKAFLKKVEVGSGKTEEFLDEKEENKKIGIEVEVYPPGKKIKSLGMLSGGERSLTSAALLFAIIDHNPPPFVFMDEVEANLDDANSLRLSRSLKDLSGKTQFILATHNKQTMKQASFLYGISMREDGCSKVYSLKLS